MSGYPYPSNGERRSQARNHPPLVREEHRTYYYQEQTSSCDPNPSAQELPTHPEHFDENPPLRNHGTRLVQPFGQPEDPDDLRRRTAERTGSDMRRRIEEDEYNRHYANADYDFHPEPTIAERVPRPYGPNPSITDSDVPNACGAAYFERHELEGSPPCPTPGTYPQSPPRTPRGRSPLPTIRDDGIRVGPKDTKNGKNVRFTPSTAGGSNAIQTRTSRTFRSRSKPRNPPIVAVFGMTGAGKSTFVQTVSGQDVKVNHGLKSCTWDIQEVRCCIDGQDVTLVDTPGFDDTFAFDKKARSDTEVLRLIASYLKDAYDDKTKLAGIIYLHNIAGNRVGGTAAKNFRILRDLCGTDNLRNVVLTTTMWEPGKEAEQVARETELLTDDEFWRRLKEKGAMVQRYHNTRAEAIDLVRLLLQREPVTLQIQHELNVEKLPLIKTAAGQRVETMLNHQEREARSKEQEIKEELEEARKESTCPLALPTTPLRPFGAGLTRCAKKLANVHCAGQMTPSSRPISRPTSRTIRTRSRRLRRISAH